MVRTWAEKEMRNLKRLHNAGIPCPTPWLLKSHVLIMDFIGSDGWCAPRLKDANIDVDRLFSCYMSIVIGMRIMYHDCCLVHGDLSEYNLLWHRNTVYIIDVSQSVEHEHPFASEFLRKDINNVSDFFRKKSLRVLSNYELFQFVTDRSLLSLHNPVVPSSQTVVSSASTPDDETEFDGNQLNDSDQNADTFRARNIKLFDELERLVEESALNAEEAEEKEDEVCDDLM